MKDGFKLLQTEAVNDIITQKRQKQIQHLLQVGGDRFCPEYKTTNQKKYQREGQKGGLPEST